jgi:hypothetical protein
MITAEDRACFVIIFDQPRLGATSGPARRRSGAAGRAVPWPGLLENLARVPDPRGPRGVRHSLTSLLLSAVAAVLAGARSFTAPGEWVADAPPQALASLGVRRDPLTGRFEPPDEATIRRVLESVDAGALDAAGRPACPCRACAGCIGCAFYRKAKCSAWI